MTFFSLAFIFLLLSLGIFLVYLTTPWWTKKRVWKCLQNTRYAYRGRHRFAMPRIEPERIFIGHKVPFGRMCGQRPGQGHGWLGFIDIWGRLHIERFIQ